MKSNCKVKTIFLLGYLILAALLAIFAFLMMQFPRTLPDTMYKLLRHEMLEEDPNTKEELTKDSDLPHLLQLVKMRQRKAKPTLTSNDL